MTVWQNKSFLEVFCGNIFGVARPGLVSLINLTVAHYIHLLVMLEISRLLSSYGHYR